jgi:hypothetical protein
VLQRAAKKAKVFETQKIVKRLKKCVLSFASGLIDLTLNYDDATGLTRSKRNPQTI